MVLDAATLTGIGIATAFGLLLVLIGAILTVRLVCDALFERRFAPEGVDEPEVDESRDRALAAAIAVATLASRPQQIVRRDSGPSAPAERSA